MKRAAIVDVGTLPFLTFTRALVFTGKSRSTIERAIRTELLVVAGRVGGRGERVFRREDLEAWMLGETAEHEAPTVRRLPRTARPTPDVSVALDRIRRAGGGVRA